MWQRFTMRARDTIYFAQEEAQQLGENYVSTEHLLLGLVRQEKSVAMIILERTGVTVGRIRLEIADQITRGDAKPEQEMYLTPRAHHAIEMAYEEAKQLDNNYIGTEHLLLGLIRERDGLAARVLSNVGAELDRIREEIRKLQDNDSGATANPPQPE